MSIRILDRLFGTAEEINGRNRCETYLYRWTLLSTRWFKAYLHHFVGDDWSRDLHDHPKRFISIGLWGWYIEETYLFSNFAMSDAPSAKMTVTRKYRAPWIRTFPASHIHRLSVPSKNCWTLVIVLKTVREWGFWHNGSFIWWRSYVDGADSHIADEMKDCQ
jgi:hypothetical protein